jgi:hypothetical protein
MPVCSELCQNIRLIPGINYFAAFLRIKWANKTQGDEKLAEA